MTLRPPEEIAHRAHALYARLCSPTDREHLSALEAARLWAQVEALAWVLGGPETAAPMEATEATDPAADAPELHSQPTLISVPILRRFGHRDDLVIAGFPALLRPPFQRGPVSVIVPLGQIPALAREYERLLASDAPTRRAPPATQPLSPSRLHPPLAPTPLPLPSHDPEREPEPEPPPAA